MLTDIIVLSITVLFVLGIVALLLYAFKKSNENFKKEWAKRKQSADTLKKASQSTHAQSLSEFATGCLLPIAILIAIAWFISGFFAGNEEKKNCIRWYSDTPTAQVPASCLKYFR